MHKLIGITVIAAALLLPSGAFAASRGSTAGARLAQICEAGSRDVTGLPIDQYQRNLKANDSQRAALDELAAAVTKTVQDIKAACPAETPQTAPDRLAAMQKRIEAMVTAVATLQPPLEKFYGLLDDEQKEQMIALNQRQGRGGSLLDADCASAQPGIAEWPTADIDRTVRPTEAQRASLSALQDAAAKAAEISKSACPAESPLTPTARLAAVGKRLDVLLRAAKTVSAPLNDFYGTLDDEQKARFNAISLPQTSQADQSKTKPTTAVHRHHFVSFGYVIRRFFHLF